MRFFLCSKIHNARVTHADVHYVGSITIDEALMEKAGLMTGEKVLVVSNTTGARLNTYVIPGEKGSGMIGMNGGAAHRIKAGEEIIIMGFELADEPLDPKIVLVDEANRFLRYL
ncbi:MAG TPA: aspartate 1-decarboxylase [Anaerolineae bacterium]|nr:aspartate 1-decarboxylase [Anaerolineae bacterium]